MDYKVILSVAALIFSGSMLVESLRPANASMPVGMQHGQFPFEHFTNCDLPGATVHSSNNYCLYSFTNAFTQTLLTVPIDRIFVVTGASVGRSDCNFLSNGVPLINQELLDDSNASPLLHGGGHLVIGAGATLEVHLRSAYCPYYIEGYYAHL